MSYPVLNSYGTEGGEAFDIGISKLSSVCAIVAIKLSLLSLRHSFATHLLDKETDIRYIKELLGHFDIKTTERYPHESKSQLTSIKSPLDALIKGGAIN